VSARGPSPAEVALGLAAADRAADDPLFRAEVERLEATTVLLAELDPRAWRLPEPPPLAPAPARARSRRWRALAPVAAALVAAAAAAFVLARPDRAETVRLRPLAGVQGRATLTISGASAELRGAGLRPSGPHDYYEAWLADARGRMVSMGTFRVARDGRVDAHMPVAVDLHRYRVVDVSLEPDDGNPAHSTRSVLRATI
jgi:anti-sigma-K factor RskA